MQVNTEQKKIKSLARKMLQVMKDVGKVQKKGYNAFLKYKYVLEEDVAKHLSKALYAHNVGMFYTMMSHERTPQKIMNKEGWLTTVKIKLKFVDCDTGEEFEGEYYGDGADNQDKGIYKAITGAVKSALMKTFLISAGEDPEKSFGLRPDCEPEPPRSMRTPIAAQVKKNAATLEEKLPQTIFPEVEECAPPLKYEEALPRDPAQLCAQLKKAKENGGDDEFLKIWSSLTEKEKLSVRAERAKEVAANQLSTANLSQKKEGEIK